MTSRRQFTTGLLSLAAVAAAPGIVRAQQRAVPKEFKIGFQKGSAILVLARRQQVIEKRLKALGVDEVKWVEFQFGPPLLEGLGLGAVHIGSVGDTPPIFAQVANAKLVYAAASPSAQHAVLVPKDSPIRTLADLKGKKVAFGKGSSAHNVTVKALAQAGLTLKDIEPTYLAPADATAAFTGKQIDAWTVWDPYYAIAEQRYQARALADTSDKRLASHSYYLANSAFAQEYPDVLAAVIDELAKLVAWAGQNRGDLAKLSAEATGIDAPIFDIAFKRAEFAVTPVTDEHVALQQQLADTFYELGIVPRRIKVADIVWRGPSR